jgi:hypothetical protein
VRPFSLSNPQALAGRTFRLDRLLVPPTEGLADIDAAFRQINVDLIEQEARRETEEALAAPSLSLRTEPPWMRSDRATRPGSMIHPG